MEVWIESRRWQGSLDRSSPRGSIGKLSLNDRVLIGASQKILIEASLSLRKKEGVIPTPLF